MLTLNATAHMSLLFCEAQHPSGPFPFLGNRKLVLGLKITQLSHMKPAGALKTNSLFRKCTAQTHEFLTHLFLQS